MLKKKRMESGLTQQRLADLSGVPRRTIQDWERFGADRAVLGKIKKVADALGCKVDDLM